MGRKLKKRRVHRSTSTRAERRITLAGLSPLLPALAVLAMVGFAIIGLERLKSRVLSQPEYTQPVTLKLEYAPGAEWVEQEGWLPRIRAAVQLPERSPMMKADLLKRVHDQIAASGWVKRVDRITCGMGGTISVLCEYRRPIAMLYAEGGEYKTGKYVPIDREGYHLPEVYDRVESDSGWMRIVGVRSAPPVPGRAFTAEAEDAIAAVRLAALLFDQPEISDRIGGIDVSNYNGRQDARKTHIQLWTRDGRMVRWGSAIGNEIEEPSVADKLRNLALSLKRNLPQAYVDLRHDPNGVYIGPAGE